MWIWNIPKKNMSPKYNLSHFFPWNVYVAHMHNAYIAQTV